ncbi:DMT family transporter [Nitrospirillum viridazoti]|uniref:EamA family transporter n=1 Tax=Nitrospirillum viridazoti CBAmc TaxID=1441467 RepID=A0A248JW92_9PROT|nr:EamA family transporter [Nitrospirillum amazonense]ASG22849.1 EamA family transporter [Nitrospirillum amazonense CBAmc]TWB33689.1 drug/metabolite transporter (DMT)-like permease [Nitrospirillum amazonense]
MSATPLAPTCDSAATVGLAPSKGTRLDGGTLAIVVVTIVIWASAFAAIRAGLKAFGPLELGAARFSIAAVPAGLYLLISRPSLPRLGEVWRFATGGLLFVALYTALLNMGERTVSSGAAAFIININPIITAVFASFLLGERFGRWGWIGTAVSFSGIGLIALNEAVGSGTGLQLGWGALLVLGAALCNSITTVVQKPLFARHKPLTVSASNMVIGALALSPWLPGAYAQAQAAPLPGLMAALYLGVMPSLVAYATWTIVLSRMPAARASNFLYCAPPLAMLLGYVWLGEVPTVMGIIGGLMALGGVAIVNLKR